MKTIFLIFTFSLFSSLTMAEDFPGRNGYVTDRYGDIVRDNYGACWHSGSWTPALAIPECEGSAMKKTSAPGKSAHVNAHRGTSSSSASSYE